MDKAMNVYLANLTLRDKREQANASLINQYTRLADRTASVEAKLHSIETGTGKSAGADTESTLGDLVKHLRSELVSAREELARTQQSETSARERVTQLTSELETTRKDVNTHIKQVALLTRKLKDRDAEAREQRKLIERIQDEMVGLNLEKNMAEQKKESAEKELEELEGRLMEWKRREAEKMNDESK